MRLRYKVIIGIAVAIVIVLLGRFIQIEMSDNAEQKARAIFAVMDHFGGCLNCVSINDSEIIKYLKNEHNCEIASADLCENSNSKISMGVTESLFWQNGYIVQKYSHDLCSWTFATIKLEEIAGGKSYQISDVDSAHFDTFCLQKKSANKRLQGTP